MSFSPLGSYLPGNSWLHRLRPGAKLLGLLVFAATAVALRTVPSTLIALACASVLSFMAGMRARDFARVALRFALVGVLLFAFQAWQHGWERGLSVVGTLFALILAASALTASTSVDDLLDTLVWALRPLRPLGVRPEKVALAFSLVLRAIPVMLTLAHDTRAAARARGLERSMRAFAVPFVLRTVAHAQHTGDALQARGLGDE
ncbi:MAG: energy-coupling factor transporter transmembrane protein EcfT [Leucobacter sp.]|nr:energy-coupling factor transporter transmembrane protein EcfT [Leucobacter sp.]